MSCSVHDAVRLEARGIPTATLLDSQSRQKVEARKVQIESLVAAALIRPTLATREDDELLRQKVPDEARLTAALALLANDCDPTVRANATAWSRRRP